MSRQPVVLISFSSMYLVDEPHEKRDHAADGFDEIGSRQVTVPLCDKVGNGANPAQDLGVRERVPCELNRWGGKARHRVCVVGRGRRGSKAVAPTRFR